MQISTIIRSVLAITCGLALGYVSWRAADMTITQTVSADWPRAHGYVRNSRVLASDANPFIDELELDYTYQVGTEWLVGDRLTFFGHGLSVLMRVGSPDDMAAAFPEGAPIEVAFDPADPRRAVLTPGITATEFGAAALFVLGVGGIGLGMIVHGYTRISGELAERKRLAESAAILSPQARPQPARANAA